MYLWKRFKNLSLLQEITIVLILKIAVLMMIWLLFFRGHYVEVSPETILEPSQHQSK